MGLKGRPASHAAAGKYKWQIDGGEAVPLEQAVPLAPRAPMPTRTVPHVYEFAHEVRPEHDHDWTEVPGDEGATWRLREERNKLIKAKLQSGSHVAYRSGGYSLVPRVYHNDMCEYEPVTRDEQVNVGDIVFCQIRELRGRR